MKKIAWVLALTVALAWTAPALAREQDPKIEVGPPRTAQELGVTLGAAAINIVYFPLRLALTLVTAELGGVAGWMTGGETQSAHAVWNSTDGEAYVTPAMLEGRQQLHFGAPPTGWH